MVLLGSLDKIGEVVGSLVLMWNKLVSGVPADKLPILAYIGFSILALLLWAVVVRVLPKTLAGLSWIILFAILLTPTTSIGTDPQMAPAAAGIVYGILMKDQNIIFGSLLPILVVITVGCILGFFWQFIKGLLPKSAAKKDGTTPNEPPSGDTQLPA